jgi:Tfp pilus assembly protein PilN
LKNINLLPRKPIIHQIFLPLLVAMIIVFLGFGIYLFFYSFTTNMNIDAEQKKVDQAKARIITLTAMHQVDPLTQDYTAFLTKINQLKSGRRDWAPIFDLITKSLYKSSRLLTMDVNDKEVMSINLEFASFKEVAYYTILLQNSTLVDQVSIKDISISKKSKAVGPSPSTPVSQLGAGNPKSAIQTNTLISYSVSMEIQLKSLVSGK